MKAINLIMQCYKEKFEIIKSESEFIVHKRYMKEINIYDTLYKFLICFIPIRFIRTLLFNTYGIHQVKTIHNFMYVQAPLCNIY